MKNKIVMSVLSLEKINKVVQEFNLGSFELDYEASSGIGCVLNMTFNQKIKGHDVTVTVPIVGVEDW
jgi:hypothetical protein